MKMFSRTENDFPAPSGAAQSAEQFDANSNK
jgi:hypothetical protein